MCRSCRQIRVIIVPLTETLMDVPARRTEPCQQQQKDVDWKWWWWVNGFSKLQSIYPSIQPCPVHLIPHQNTRCCCCLACPIDLSVHLHICSEYNIHPSIHVAWLAGMMDCDRLCWAKTTESTIYGRKTDITQQQGDACQSNRQPDIQGRWRMRG